MVTVAESRFVPEFPQKSIDTSMAADRKTRSVPSNVEEPVIESREGGEENVLVGSISFEAEKEMV
jgi:hypothetical protein